MTDESILKPFSGFEVSGGALNIVLGLPNGSGVAWLLIGHVTDLGHQYINVVYFLARRRASCVGRFT